MRAFRLMMITGCNPGTKQLIIMMINRAQSGYETKLVDGPRPRCCFASATPTGKRPMVASDIRHEALKATPKPMEQAVST